MCLESENSSRRAKKMKGTSGLHYRVNDYADIDAAKRLGAQTTKLAPLVGIILLSVRFQSRLVLHYYCIHACVATLPFPLSTTAELQRWRSGRPRNVRFFPTTTTPTPITTATTTTTPFSSSSCASPFSSYILVSLCRYYDVGLSGPRTYRNSRYIHDLKKNRRTWTYYRYARV